MIIFGAIFLYLLIGLFSCWLIELDSPMPEYHPLVKLVTRSFVTLFWPFALACAFSS